MTHDNDTLQPLGEDDARIQITVLPDGGPTGLLTVRGKDHDLTAVQFRALAAAATQAAEWLEKVGGTND